MATARQQADDFGVDRHQGEEVTDVDVTDDGFVVTTDDDEYEADYVVLATGASRDLAEAIGCEFDDDGTVSVDISMETSVSDLYATGATCRADEWQAVIAAGDGAAAALNVLTKVRGEGFHDFDVPATADEVFGGLIDE